MHHQTERARRMLQAGAPLGRVLKGRVGMELRMIVLGGERILRQLHDARGDVFRHRPVLRRSDWVYMALRALGHPVVYYDMGEEDFVECLYCDRRFVLADGTGDTH